MLAGFDSIKQKVARKNSYATIQREKITADFVFQPDGSVLAHLPRKWLDHWESVDEAGHCG